MPTLLVKELSVSPQTSVLQAVKVLQATHRRIILVVDGGGKLLGVVADQDVRRAVLERVPFDAAVTRIMTRAPVTCSPNAAPVDVLQLMESTYCHEVPVVDEDGVVVDVRFYRDERRTVSSWSRSGGPRSGPDPALVAVVMAGGRGTRLRPLTNDLPKPLLPVGGRPILSIILDQLIESGFGRIVVAANYRGDQIDRLVRGVARYHGIVTTVQEPVELGTAGALSRLPEAPRTPFLVMNGDLLTQIPLWEMMECHRREKNMVTVALKPEQVEVPYGVADLDGMRIVALREKPTLSFFVNTGVYVLDPEVLEDIPADGPTDMPDVIRLMVHRGARVGCFPVHEYWLDIGRPEEMERAHREYAMAFEDELERAS